MIFVKEDLLGSYDWNPASPLLSFEGGVTRRLFNRWDGGHVLFMINIFLHNIEEPSVEKGRKAEWLIMEKLPSGAKSEMSVLQWLLEQKLDTVM